MDSQGKIRVTLPELLAIRQQVQQLKQTGHPVMQALAGLHFSRLRGRSLEFDQVRSYQPGDDARHIDWRASARSGKIQTRLFHEEHEQPVFILVEQSPHMFFASTGSFKSVQAARIASLFAWAAYERHDRIGGLIFGETPAAFLPAQRGKNGLLMMLQALAASNQALHTPQPATAGNPLSLALDHVSTRLPPDCLLILICSATHLQTDNSRLLNSLMTRVDTLLVPVFDPLEYLLPERAPLAFELEGHTRYWDGNARSRKLWAQQALHIRRAWQKLARQHAMPLLPISTRGALTEQLLLWGQQEQTGAA